jgi:hypothetical protein
MCEPYSPYIVAEYMATHNPPNGRVKQEKKPKLLPKFNYYLDESYESGCILLSMSEKRSLEESESSRLEGLYRKASDPVLRTHLLMVWRMSLGDSIREVARIGRLFGEVDQADSEALRGARSRGSWRPPARQSSGAKQRERCSTRRAKLS